MLEHLITNPREREQIRNAGWQVVFDQLQLRLLRRGHSQILSKFYQQATCILHCGVRSGTATDRK